MCTIPKAKAITPAEDKSSLRSKIDPMKITLISNRICNANDFFGLNLWENNRIITFVSYLMNSLNPSVLLMSNKKNVSQKMKNKLDTYQGN